MSDRVDELRALRVRLKSGEYDGVVIMTAWIAIEEYANLLARTAVQQAVGRCPTCDRWLEARCPVCGPVNQPAVTE